MDCGAGGLLDLPLVPIAIAGLPLGRLVPPPLAGRAVAVFLILSPSPQSPRSRIGDDFVALPHVVHEAGAQGILLQPRVVRCRLPFSSPPGILPNEYDAIVPLRLPCGDAVGDTPNRDVAPSLVTHHASHPRSLRGCWKVFEALLKASGVWPCRIFLLRCLSMYSHTRFGAFPPGSIVKDGTMISQSPCPYRYRFISKPANFALLGATHYFPRLSTYPGESRCSTIGMFCWYEVSSEKR